MHRARQMGFPQAPDLARIVHAPRSRGRESAHSPFQGNQRLLRSPARGARRGTLITRGNEDVGGSHNAVRPGPGASHDRNHRRPARIALLLTLAFCLLTAGRVHAGGEIELAGDVLQYALPATAVGLTLGYKDGKGALQLGASMAVTLGVTYVLKYAVDSERPNGGSQSFPSGHTSASFSSAEFMRKRYGWEYGVPAYAAATFVAYSRVESREHHPQDVVAGAAIGIIASYVFTKPYEGWEVQVDGDSRNWGFRVSRRW